MRERLHLYSLRGLACSTTVCQPMLCQARCTGEGWLYLAIMLDLLSRQIVGWQMSSRIDTPLVKDALQAALVNRGHPKGVMIHSDRGSQYCAKTFREMVDDNKLTQSMSRKGNCWDNAVAESFFASLKNKPFMAHGSRRGSRLAKPSLNTSSITTIEFAGIQTTDGLRQSSLNACINNL